MPGERSVHHSYERRSASILAGLPADARNRPDIDMAFLGGQQIGLGSAKRLRSESRVPVVSHTLALRRQEGAKCWCRLSDSNSTTPSLRMMWWVTSRQREFW